MFLAAKSLLIAVMVKTRFSISLPPPSKCLPYCSYAWVSPIPETTAYGFDLSNFIIAFQRGFLHPPVKLIFYCCTRYKFILKDSMACHSRSLCRNTMKLKPVTSCHSSNVCQCCQFCICRGCPI